MAITLLSLTEKIGRCVTGRCKSLPVTAFYADISCSSIAVVNGQEVKKGQIIAYVGTTGNSTGNHLHFELYKNGERTNPLGYFK